MFTYSRFIELLLKGHGHKYIKRIPYNTPKGRRYRYIYNVTHSHQGKHVMDESHLVEGTKFMVHTESGKEIHAHIKSVNGNKVTYVLDDGPYKGKEVTKTRSEIVSLLNDTHGVDDKVNAKREQLRTQIEQARKTGTEKQVARLEERLKRLGGEPAKKETEPSSELKKVGAEIDKILEKIDALEDEGEDEKADKMRRKLSKLETKFNELRDKEKPAKKEEPITSDEDDEVIRPLSEKFSAPRKELTILEIIRQNKKVSSRHSHYFERAIFRIGRSLISDMRELKEGNQREEDIQRDLALALNLPRDARIDRIMYKLLSDKDIRLTSELTDEQFAEKAQSVIDEHEKLKAEAQQREEKRQAKRDEENRRQEKERQDERTIGMVSSFVADAAVTQEQARRARGEFKPHEIRLFKEVRDEYGYLELDKHLKGITKNNAYDKLLSLSLATEKARKRLKKHRKRKKYGADLEEIKTMSKEVEIARDDGTLRTESLEVLRPRLSLGKEKYVVVPYKNGGGFNVTVNDKGSFAHGLSLFSIDCPVALLGLKGEGSSLRYELERLPPPPKDKDSDRTALKNTVNELVEKAEELQNHELAPDIVLDEAYSRIFSKLSENDKEVGRKEAEKIKTAKDAQKAWDKISKKG